MHALSSLLAYVQFGQCKCFPCIMLGTIRGSSTEDSSSGPQAPLPSVPLPQLWLYSAVSSTISGGPKVEALSPAGIK